MRPAFTIRDMGSAPCWILGPPLCQLANVSSNLPDMSITPSGSLARGTRVGRYEIVAFLAAGGMGEVYEARDTNLGRAVALKILPQELMANAERTARFVREAQA